MHEWEQECMGGRWCMSVGLRTCGWHSRHMYSPPAHAAPSPSILLAVAIWVCTGDRAATVASWRCEQAATLPLSPHLNIDGAARPHAPGGWYVPAGLEDSSLEVECISTNADGASAAGMDFPMGGQSSTEQGRHNIWIAVNDLAIICHMDEQT